MNLSWNAIARRHLTADDSYLREWAADLAELKQESVLLLSKRACLVCKMQDFDWPEYNCSAVRAN